MKEVKEHIATNLVPQLRFIEFDGDWEKHTLKYLLGSLVDCEHKTAPYVDESDYLVVRTNNVKGGQLVYNDIKYTTEKGFTEWTKRTVPKFGDILFTREAPAGESCLVPENKKVCLGQRMVLLKSDESKMAGQYLSSYLQSGSAIRDISNLSIGTTATRINIADIYKLKCPVSTIPEQQKIASFLSAVDKKIQQLIQKKAVLEQYKKGVMQQLFSGQLRFKDNNGSPYSDWEEKLLGEIADKVNKKNKDNSVNYVLTNSATQGIVSQSDYFDRDIANQNNLEGYYVVEVNDFVYNPRISVHAPVGPVKRNKLKEGVMSPLYTVFRFKDVDLIYLECFFSTIEWHKYLNSVANFGARHDRMNISQQDFFKMPIPFPCEEEQQKIATYLSSIDTKIEAVNNQITQTQTFKKGLLQQMFV